MSPTSSCIPNTPYTVFLDFDSLQRLYDNSASYSIIHRLAYHEIPLLVKVTIERSKSTNRAQFLSLFSILRQCLRTVFPKTFFVYFVEFFGCLSFDTYYSITLPKHSLFSKMVYGDTPPTLSIFRNPLSSMFVTTTPISSICASSNTFLSLVPVFQTIKLQLVYSITVDVPFSSFKNNTCDFLFSATGTVNLCEFLYQFPSSPKFPISALTPQLCFDQKISFSNMLRNNHF